MPHIFLTGQPGCGKSTLIQRVLQGLGSTLDVRTKVKGFYTEEVRVGGERTGFDVVTVAGQRGVLSRAGADLRGPAVGKYVVDLPSFEALGLPELLPAAGVLLYVVDEVGKMELLSNKFFPAVTALLDAATQQRCLVIGTVPAARGGHSLAQVVAVKARDDVEVLTVTRENRDQLAQQVLQHVRRQLEAAAAGGGGGGRAG